MKNNIAKNFAYLFATKGIDFLVPLLILPILVNRLTLDGFGAMSFALAIGIYFSSLMQYGYNITAVREIARARDDRQALSAVYSQMITSSLILCVGFSLCYSLLFFIPSVAAQWPLYLSVLFFVFMQSFYPAWFFQGIEQMQNIALINSLTKLIYIALVYFWVVDSNDTYLPPLLQGASLLVGIILAFSQIKRKQWVSYSIPSGEQIFDSYRQGWSAFVTQIAPTLYSNSMTFILGLFSSNALVGIYSAAMRVIEIFNAFSFLLVNAVTPQLSRNIAIHSWVKKLFFVAGLGLTGFAAIAAPYFVPLLFKDQQTQIINIIQWASPMILMVFIRMAYGPAYLMLTGKEKPYKNIVFGYSLLGFSLAWLVIPKWQEMGAVMVLVGTSVLMTLATWYAVKKFEHNN